MDASDPKWVNSIIDIIGVNSLTVGSIWIILLINWFNLGKLMWLLITYGVSEF